MSVEDLVKAAAQSAQGEERELSRGDLVATVADGLVAAVTNTVRVLLASVHAGVEQRPAESNGSGEVVTAERLVCFEILSGRRGVSVDDREFQLFAAACEQEPPR